MPTRRSGSLCWRRTGRNRDRLQEPAELQSEHPTVIIENETDVFEGGGGAPKRLALYHDRPEDDGTRQD